MNIRLNVPTPSDYISDVLLEKLRTDLLKVNIHLHQISIPSFADGVAVVDAVVYPAHDLSYLSVAEIQSRAQAQVDIIAAANKPVHFTDEQKAAIEAMIAAK